MGTALLLVICLASPGRSAEGPGAATASPAVKKPPALKDMRRLIKVLGSDDVVAQRRGKEAILTLLNGEDWEAALTALQDGLRVGTFKEKVWGAQVLGNWGKPQGAEFLAGLLEDSNKFVRLAALTALGQVKPKNPSVIEEVRELLESDDRQVRRRAAIALGHMKDEASAARLIELMSGDDEITRGNARFALEQITGKKLGGNVERWRAWQETRDQMEERAFKRKQQESVAMRKAVREVAKPKEEPVDRAALHLSLSFSGLALLLLLAASVWVVMPSWLNSKISLAEDRRAKGQGMNIAELARRFRASDHMPDFVVYPFLLSALANGSSAQKEIALRLLELRAFGGCRLLTNKTGGRGRGEPTKVARRWISSLPRSLLEDLAVLRGPGRRLIGVLDPDNPRWKRSPTRDETRKAQRSYNSWLGKTA